MSRSGYCILMIAGFAGLWGAVCEKAVPYSGFAWAAAGLFGLVMVSRHDDREFAHRHGLDKPQ